MSTTTTTTKETTKNMEAILGEILGRNFMARCPQQSQQRQSYAFVFLNINTVLIIDLT